MCLLLQGFLFDGSRVDADKFRAAQRPISCPTHGTEPPYPRLAANALLSGLKESLGSQEGTGNHTWCPVPFCPCRWAPTSLGRGDGQSRLQRRAAVSAEGLPSAEGKERRDLCRRLAAKGGTLFRERPTGKSLIYLKYFTPFANSG